MSSRSWFIAGISSGIGHRGQTSFRFASSRSSSRGFGTTAPRLNTIGVELGRLRG